jgi:hypothetical protein
MEWLCIYKKKCMDFLASLFFFDVTSVLFHMQIHRYADTHPEVAAKILIRPLQLVSSTPMENDCSPIAIGSDGHTYVKNAI